MDAYEPQAIEQKWQRVWDEADAFVTPNPADPSAPDASKAYVLEMLPYPSGELHMGHVLNYTLGDVVSHVRRRTGHHILRPMGYDAFGLPAENAAIREGGHPRQVTERNIAAIRRQIKRMGWSIDWTREVSTHEPEYYRWTQWLFLKLYDAGLAYRKNAPVKWCPNDQTVLANEQVVDGNCERCGAEVESRKLEQWMFKITAYADRLLDDMSLLESWPERVLTMQRNWIGRSEGGEILFRIEEFDEDVPVFTTRPDTLFGATFFVLAPEHPLVERFAERLDSPAGLRAYVRRATAKKSEERAANEEKTGVFTGFYAVNPVNDTRIPIWVADYVLMDYGTGAIMAVPAHDERDFAFAQAFDLPVVQVVAPAEGEVEEGAVYVSHADDDLIVNSAQFSGLPSPQAKKAIVESLADRGLGKEAVNYRLRDWLLSRQRYWGCPIPIIHCESCGVVPVPEADLPVILPEIEDYLPKGRSPLAAAEDWVATTCPACGAAARRETDTMDTFVDSSWYFLRYTDPQNAEAPFDRDTVDFWLPVNQYIGGIEHAILHLMYARFFTKALYDIGLVGFKEPFARLFNQGMIYRYGAKMSKSKGNVVSPDELIERYGADALRLYILFMGPADQDKEWQDTGVDGTSRFLQRLWRVVHEELELAPTGVTTGTPLARKAHETIAKVTDDIERRFVFNTPVAAVMELVNAISAGSGDPASRFAVETAVSLIQPYAPHAAEELWEKLGHGRLWAEPWPVADQSQLVRDTVELVVQVNGKVRDRFPVAAGLPEVELVALARASEKVAAHLEGKELRKVFSVPDKLVNFVV
ncbi:MAG: leucine--tRNA ligase [Actinomycetes bacterium]